MKFALLAGTTSKTIKVFIQDSSSTTGAGLTGLAYNSAGLSAYYVREGAASSGVQITLVTATTGTWTSGGFVQVGPTNMPGVYELGLPNAAIASGANSVLIMLKGATNMAPCLVEIQLSEVPANLKSIDEQATNGNNATFYLKELNIVNNSGSAITATSTGGNGHGMVLNAHGSGIGLRAIAGSTGDGARFTGGSTSGHGFACYGSTAGAGAGLIAQALGTDYAGILTTGIGNGPGLNCIGGATGHGIRSYGGSTSGDGLNVQGNGSGHGIYAVGTSNNDGMHVAGNGSGHGLRATAGTTGNGIQALGGSTSGAALYAIAINGHGIHADAAGAGVGLYCEGGGSGGHGMQLVGFTTGSGILATAGSTGNAVSLVGGSTSGKGINISTTDGHGIDISASGTSKVDINADITGNFTGDISGSVGSVATNGITAASLATDAGTEIATAVWANETRTLSAATNITSTGGSIPITAAGLVSSDITAIATSTTAAAGMKNMSLAVVSGTVVTDGGNTSTTFKTDLTESTTDAYGNADGGSCLVFITGDNSNESRRISAYNGTTKFITVESAFSNTPSNTDAFIIVGRIEV